MRRFIIRFSQLSILSFIIAFGYILFPSKTYLHASEWNIKVPAWLSDYRETTVWGQPAHFIVDHPYTPGVGRIDAGDHFYGGALFINWVLWLIVVALIYTIALVLMWIVRRLGSFAARKT
jgi:hypothetical protein